MPVPALEVRGITKQFPGVLANDNINFTIEKSQIHGMLGENGAGKTTLMNVIYGLYQPDAGEILVNGEPVSIHSANDAIRLGIGMVHQHFMLIPELTVTENIILGNELTIGPFLNRRTAKTQILELSERFGLVIDPDALVGDLPVGARQRVEIIKALYRKADILILDEPTAVLTPQEAQDLFEVMHNLVRQGVSIVFITHKLKEVLAVADQITVLRRGKVAGTTTPEEATEASLAALMVGREVILLIDKEAAQPGEPVLIATDLVVEDDRGHIAVNGISMEVRKGEILGIAGVQGNGQTELVEALTGLRTPKSGQITILNQDTTFASPRQITEIGVAHIPEDREKDGLVKVYPIIDNLVLNTYYRPPFANGIIMNEEEMKKNAQEVVEKFDIRTPSILAQAGTLSGGNKQKMIVGREFSRSIKLLIAAQPTRGLDVGSIEFIHQQIVSRRDEGVAVLLVSAELDEIMALSDHIAVIYRGQILETIARKDTDRNHLGLLMAGIHDENRASS
jgi:general nucleoside transport system ATP-binding protein